MLQNTGINGKYIYQYRFMYFNHCEDIIVLQRFLTFLSHYRSLNGTKLQFSYFITSRHNVIYMVSKTLQKRHSIKLIAVIRLRFIDVLILSKHICYCKPKIKSSRDILCNCYLFSFLSKIFYLFHQKINT